MIDMDLINNINNINSTLNNGEVSSNKPPFSQNISKEIDIESKRRGPKSFHKFKVETQTSIAHALYNWANKQYSEHHNPVKILVYYFACGINKHYHPSFQLDYQGKSKYSYIIINNHKVPIFDEHEEWLYKQIFKGWSVWEYTPLTGYYSDVGYIQVFLKKHPIEFIKINTNWSITALRNLRLWALLHDYKVSHELISAWYPHIKEYWFPVDEERINELSKSILSQKLQF
ncbi:MAG: hypothetical protein ACP5RI_02875 [Candidatus Micrarchaeia archaeon]